MLRPAAARRAAVRTALLPTVLTALGAVAARAQAPAPTLPALTRAEAVALALARGAAARVGRADTAAARAAVAVAAALPNPTLALTATRSAPQLHATVDLPVDLPALRRLRVGGARAALDAARLQFAFTRATVRYDVEVAYGQALAAAERARLSRETARDADSLLVLARLRRDAGDASDLDADLAAVNAGQQANAADADSLAALGALADLQVLAGLPGDAPRVRLAEALPALVASARSADSVLGNTLGEAAGHALGAVPPAVRPGAAASGAVAPGAAPPTPLPVAAAQATYVAQDLALGLARRRNALVPSVQVGVEGRDPTGGPAGPLPVVGVSVPLPLLNRARGDVALAAADRERAAAQLELARRTAEAAIARARRELRVGGARVARDSALLAAARRVAARTLTGYREGAAALPDVLQAQRAVRDAFAQFAADAAAAATAAAAVRLATSTAETP